MPAWLIPAAMTLGGALLGSRKVKAPKVQQVDISGELAKLDALYDAQRQGVSANLAAQLAAANRRTSSNLAGRGIYSSPVSQYAMGENEAAYSRGLADALASIAGQQAQTRASLTGSLASQQQQQAYEAAMAKYQGKLQSRNALSGALMGGGLAGMLDGGVDSLWASLSGLFKKKDTGTSGGVGYGETGDKISSMARANALAQMLKPF